MDSIQAITGPGTAFVAGLVTSLHCALMCGPLACFLAPRKDEPVTLLQAAAVYHGTRVLSYTLIGALAGGLGLLAFSWLESYTLTPARFLPWALVLFFLAIAFRVDRWIPQSRWAAMRLFKVRNRVQQMPRLSASAVMGSLTPLLPCAPLYAVFGLALMTQSPVQGAEFLFAFGAGTVALLALAQSQWVRLQGRFSPRQIALVQRSLALLVAAVIAWRLYLFETSADGFFCGS
ncbi:MAG: sulfite exporter TauE/SafE family protein [Opitutales bacterium]|nr:sulfite exporter TauE/SafE family protein [Opitutales bacterium]